MKILWGRLFPALIVLVGLFHSCADPTFVGGDILNEDRVSAAFTDTVTIRSRTIQGDSVLTYSARRIWLSGYLFGDYQDPVYGRTYSEIYTQPTLEASSVSFLRPNFRDAVFDSVVLVLPYKGAGFYGNTEQFFSLEVYELADSLERDSTYYSTDRFQIGDLIGSKEFVPRLDSVTYIDYRTNTPDTVSRSQLRVQLDDFFGLRLVNADTSEYLTNGDFLNFFSGLAIRPTRPTDGMISFDMVPTGGAFDAGIYVYYRRDSLKLQYRFPISFSSPVTSYIENDYSGTIMEPFIGSYAFNDSIGFVQGTPGLLMELEFPHLEGLQDVIVNKAELEIPIAAVDGDNPIDFPPARQLFAFYYDPDVAGNYATIDDVVLPAPNALDVVFGGLIEAGTNGRPDVYRMNISAWFQEMLKDDRETDIRDVLYLAVAPRSERISRTALYGAGHPRFPIKLNLTYTTQ